MSRYGKKRDEPDLVDVFHALPVWAGPVFAVITFATLRWLVPWFMSAQAGSETEGISTFWTTWGPVSVFVAPFGAGFVLVAWIVALFLQRKDRLRLASQTGIESIRQLDWQDFERLVAEVYRKRGYTVHHTGSGTSDGGVDLRIETAGVITLVHCKRWKGKVVGVTIPRELLGVVTSEGADNGIVVTSGAFSPDAIRIAKRTPITLVDGYEFARMVRGAQVTIERPAKGPQGVRRRRKW